MELFSNWWNDLSTLGQLFATAAIPATVVMFLQTVLLLLGIGGHFDADSAEDINVDIPHGAGDHDADYADLDDPADHFEGVRLFTVRGIGAMLAVGGWLGVAMCDLGVHSVIAVAVALAGGLGALFAAAYIIKATLRLQEDGNLSAKNALAHTATVYIPIPPSREGVGKVTMNLQERFVELDALTDSDVKIPTGATVQVIAVTDKNEVIVRPFIK